MTMTTPLERNPRYCLQCDDGTVLVRETKDVTDEIHGEPFTVPKVAGWHCPICGEIEFDPASDSADRYWDVMDGAGKRADVRQAAELRAQRRALKLTQAEAGNLFDNSVSAFSAYEHGKTQPHKSTVLLLRLLSKHPELLAELR